LPEHGGKRHKSEISAEPTNNEKGGTINMNIQEIIRKMKHKFIWILTSLMLIGLLGLASMSLAAEDPWVRKVDMPTARGGLSTSVVNGIIYAIGGSPGCNVVEAYEPATDTWTRKANMPTGRDMFSTSVVNGIIYAIGGATPEIAPPMAAAVEAYDPAMDTWTKKADMPTARWSLSTSVVNGKIYAIGGWDGAAVEDVEVYDPKTNTWTKKGDMPAARGGHWASVVNGIIYAIGGWTALPTIEAYDPAMDTWTRKANMPTGRGYLSTSAVNGKIYVIGGATGTAPLPKGIVEEYDEFRAPRRPAQAVEAKGKLATQWGRLKATN